MARHERDFRANAEAPLSLNEVLALLADAADGKGLSREDAIARYLSADDGWRDAGKRLGGAFADEAIGLKVRKGD